MPFPLGCSLRSCFSAFVATAFLAAETRAVEFSTSEINGQKVTICRVNMKEEKLELFLEDEAGRPLKSFDGINQWLAKRGQKLAFGMNAGMYHGNLAPVGLFVNEGRELTPLNLANDHGNFFMKPNGVFAVTTAGAHVVESSQYPRLGEKVLLATQSGPLLVLDGKIHPKFKPGSEFRLSRNGVGVPSPDVALFAIIETPVNLYDFAVFFRDVLRCPNALYFDGTVSSLHSPKLGRSDKLIDLGPVLGIVE
ncbi:MAG TPA: phosphodiester glycosidase family protein [Chthoniobacteraceae bacterium]|jgi:uncharacterized protein YigE (DUF2233 family)